MAEFFPQINNFSWKNLGIFLIFCMMLIVINLIFNDSFQMSNHSWNLIQSFVKSHAESTTPNASVNSTSPANKQGKSKHMLYVLVKENSIRGRLGNQMFIYASLLGIALKQGRNPVMENGLLVAESFNLTYIENDISAVGWKHVQEKNISKFQPTLMNLPAENLTLSGYFQSWKYFDHISFLIRLEFQFHESVRQTTSTFYIKARKMYPNTTFIGVHVRRGDTLKRKRSKDVYGNPQKSYFIKAFNYFRKMFFNRTRFLVASDDFKWCQKSLIEEDVEMLSPDSPVQHMSILSSSDHFVLSIGTFGWWCAWLCEGITIYYERESGVLPVKQDFYLPQWIGMGD